MQLIRITLEYIDRKLKGWLNFFLIFIFYLHLFNQNKVLVVHRHIWWEAQLWYQFEQQKEDIKHAFDVQLDFHQNILIILIMTVYYHTALSLAHTAWFLSLATEILSSVVSGGKEFLAYLILKIVVSDKNFYVFPAHSEFSSPATKMFVLSDENRTVCARLEV